MRRRVPLVAAMALALQSASVAGAARSGEAEELPTATEAAATTPARAELNSGYRISGSKSLRPARISDDGVHTYIEWDEDQALPAVFAVSAQGGEEMVDGYMRDGIFTIDRVNNALIFRIDKKWAKAERDSRK